MRVKIQMPLVVLMATLASACATPCDELDARVRECRYHPGRHADDRVAVCPAVRAELGAVVFDRFAGCVSDARCDDAGAIDRCQAEHLTAPGACSRLRLWAAACGLEPTGIDPQCAGLSEGMSTATFDRWVTCITAGGCPRGDDPRYDRCQEVLLPDSVADLIDACAALVGWTEACAGQGPDFAPIEAMSLTECMTTAEPFQSDSFLAYGECLRPKACDDTAGRIECLLLLRFVDPPPAIPPCQRLQAFAEACQVPIGGGSVDACTRLFARFDPISLDAYAACLETRGCDDQAALIECTSHLVLP
jgi:hypothetical protein